MRKVKFPKFLSGGVQVDPPQTEVLIDDYITRVMAYLMVYKNDEDGFEFLRANNVGASVTTKYLDNTKIRTFNDSIGAINKFKIAYENNQRYLAVINILGSVGAYLYLGDDIVDATAFIILPNGQIEIGGFTGNMYLKSLSGTQQFSLIEYARGV